MPLIENIEVISFEEPLRETFKTALREVRNLSIIRVVINGRYFGDSVETVAITGDSYEIIEKDIKRAVPVWIGMQSENVSIPPGLSRSAQAALNMALIDMDGYLPGPSRVRTDVTLPIASVEDYENLIKTRLDAGFNSLKIKFNDEPIEILIEKMRVLKELAPKANLRVDPNQSWSTDLSKIFLQNLEQESIFIDYLEQPTPAQDFLALKEIKKSSDIKVMADESVFTQLDLEELLRLQAIDVVNLKILKNGGINNVLQMAKFAHQNGIQVSIGSMMESEFGISYAIRIAQKIAPDYTHDLDAAWWLSGSSLHYVDGWVVEQ